MTMKQQSSFIIRTTKDLGQKARHQRKLQKMSIENTAPLLNLGPRFISEVERGKETAAFGKVLQLLDGIGLAVMVLPKSQAQKIERQLTADLSRDKHSEN